MSKETSKSSNPPGWSNIDKGYLENNYIKIAEESNLKDGHDGDQGVWLGEYSNAFDRKRFDLNGLTKDNWASQWVNQGMDKAPLVVFRHSGYDAEGNSDETVYTVKPQLIDATDVFSNNDAGSHREWYLDHISAHLKDGKTSDVMGPYQSPTRDNPKVITNDDGDFSVAHNYGGLECHPNQAVAIGTRGYEKDNNPPEEQGYDIGWIEYITLYKDLIKLMAQKKWGDFLLDCIAIGIRKVVNNPDDRMIPCITVFTHGACRWIKEQLGGEITFSRIISGDESEPRCISGQSGDYAQLVDDSFDWNAGAAASIYYRHYQLNYSALVLQQNTIEPGVYYQVINKAKNIRMEKGQSNDYIIVYAEAPDFDATSYCMLFEIVDKDANLFKIKSDKDRYVKLDGSDPNFPFTMTEEGGDVFEIRPRGEAGHYEILLNGIHPLTFREDLVAAYPLPGLTTYLHPIIKAEEGDQSDHTIWRIDPYYA